MTSIHTTFRTYHAEIAVWHRFVNIVSPPPLTLLVPALVNRYVTSRRLQSRPAGATRLILYDRARPACRPLSYRSACGAPFLSTAQIRLHGKNAGKNGGKKAGAAPDKRCGGCTLSGHDGQGCRTPGNRWPVAARGVRLLSPGYRTVGWSDGAFRCPPPRMARSPGSHHMSPCFRL